ncbi:hypothetical protein XELAEV_18012509mg [Xenopus laevis]|uniref:Uncharacterized protein n=1 Tax=Xenopus laevis TaxID=8355 RepID=A0A974DMS9_XENLA|nr:hypothetical protein XELAEV_18012509mg [Xenopus laevis]
MKHLNIFNIKNSFEAPFAAAPSKSLYYLQSDYYQGILLTPLIKALLKGHVCNYASLACPIGSLSVLVCCLCEILSKEYLTTVEIFKNKIFIRIGLVARRYFYIILCHWHMQ